VVGAMGGGDVQSSSPRQLVPVPIRAQGELLHLLTGAASFDPG
jgi:hypothetical protein